MSESESMNDKKVILEVAEIIFVADDEKYAYNFR